MTTENEPTPVLWFIVVKIFDLVSLVPILLIFLVACVVGNLLECILEGIKEGRAHYRELFNNAQAK